MKKRGLLLLGVFLLFSVSVAATSHYTFEHAEEMRTSGRIDWRDYGPEAFEEALDQNKPIFLMLTAPSWCYWCHVYTSDDFVYNQEIYPIINEKFIPIYVDADKRQDLTRQYLEGGWPSTTIMAPNRERLFGYSGPRPIEWMQANLNNAIGYVSSNKFKAKINYNYQKEAPIIPSYDNLRSLINSYAGYIMQAYDPEHGGFGTGQKFPQGRTLDFSLEFYERTNNKQFLDLVKNTLRNQYTDINQLENYNLFDPIDGGFHRYGTKRDWTPPHYEKMLYDNARLLKAYYHLQQIESDAIVNEVVEKTLAFIENNWYDPNGGFYGNSDVHGEDEYYGKNPRPINKPRVEKTKYSDWNSDAIITYLYIWKQSSKEKYKIMAKKTLDFFRDNMVTDSGALHYFKQDSTKGVAGSLLDNAYLLLAFVEGYETLGDESYLEAAKRIASFSLENLYDWHSGGFFERNSPDIDDYAPGENIILSKPNQENGIVAYSFLKLFSFTNNPVHLNAGLKTLGKNIDSISGLDRGYYNIKAAQLVLNNDLINKQDIEAIRQIEKENQENFWVDKLSAFNLSNQGLDKLEGPILLLILVAFFAGLISFLSPCTLPILPAYVAYTFRSSKQNIKGMTISFFLGLSMVFTLLGMTATFIGNFLRENISFFSQIAGALIVIFGIIILSGKGFTGFKIKKKNPTTYLGSFLFGAALGVSWTPCVGPILVAILLLASTSGSIFTGGLLLFIYAIGIALPLILISTYLGKINKDNRIWKFIEGKEIELIIANKKILLHTNTLISGLLFIILGYLIFSGTLFAFNQYLTTTSFQKYIFGLEDWLLGFLK